jgi:hypothetical protein
MEILSGLWSKLNKPIHYYLVGAAFLFFAPVDYHWVGYLFVSIGVAGTLEWLWRHAIIWKEERQRLHAMCRIVSYLNANEREILQAQLQKRERTFYLHQSDYRNTYMRAHNAEVYVRMVEVCKGLQQK